MEDMADQQQTRTQEGLEDLCRREIARLLVEPGLGRLRAHPPVVEVRARRYGSRTMAMARNRPRRQIIVYVDERTDHAEIRASIAHEVVHLAGWWRHDDRFRRRLARLARDAYGVRVKACGSTRDVDREIERELRRRDRLQRATALIARLWAGIRGILAI
jgi:hypothetical protein